MTLLVKDADTTTQPIATQTDSAGNLVPVHVSALAVNGIAIPIGPSNPLPVAPGGSIANDGSGTIANGGTPQMLFGGVLPANGYLICNNSAGALYVSDVGTATPGGTSIQIPPNTIFVTPPGYAPRQSVSLYGGTTGQTFAARRW
jgi:hypothetical protein